MNEIGVQVSKDLYHTVALCPRRSKSQGASVSINQFLPRRATQRCPCRRWRACRAGNTQKRCSCSRWRARCPNCSGAQNRYIIKEMLLTFVLISLSGTTQTVFYNYLQPVFQKRNYLLRRHFDKLRFLFRILRKLRFRFWLRLYTIK